MMKKLWHLFYVVFLLFHTADAQQISTLAGTAPISGNADGSGAAARFNEPASITTDPNGVMYVADRLNHKIRKILPNGSVITLAGTGTPGSADGPAGTATFNEPWGVACDALGNVYVADTRNYKVRKIDPSGVVSTLAGVGVFGTTNGPVATARFGFPAGIAVTANGSTIYVSDYNTHVIRKIEAGQVSTLAGSVFLPGATDGVGTTASFNKPYGICLTASGTLYVSDESNHKIRRVTAAGVVSTLAGSGVPGNTDGLGSIAQFNYPSAVITDTLGNIFVADAGAHTIRKVSPSGAVTTYAGLSNQPGSTDGSYTVARFNQPSGIAYSRMDRAIVVADKANHVLRKIIAVSSINLVLTVNGSTTVCTNDTLRLTIGPAGLSNYTILENTSVITTSPTPSMVLTGLTAGTHTFTAQALDANGATASSNTVTVTVLPAFTPIINSSGGSAICNGSALTLSVNSASNFQWSTGAVTSSIIITTPGSYIVTATGANGCRGTSTPFTVTLQPSPVATISSPQASVCAGQTTTLSASAGQSWAWSNGATAQNIQVTAGVYTVTVTGTGGCTAASTPISIGTLPAPSVNVSPSGSIVLLQGNTVVLQASGGTTYLWSTGQTSAAITVAQAGAYAVTVTGANGCTAVSTPVSVTFIASNNMITTQGAVSFCDGGSVQLTSLFPDGNQWYFNGLPIGGATATTFQATDDGWYSLAVWQNNAWLYSDSIRVTVYPTPDVPLANDTSVCSGNTLTLSLPSIIGSTYNWYNASEAGTLLGTGNLYTTPVITTNTVLYPEAVNNFGCASERLDLNIVVKPNPVAGFTYTMQSVSGQFTGTFTCTTSSPAQVLWIFGDTTLAGNTSDQTISQYTYSSEGAFDVTLIVTNDLGCSDTLMRTITAGARFPAFIPTTFTPNGDGRNDLFKVRGDQFLVREMRIYDQWGTLIYTTDASLPQWDGRVNGQTVQNGTYVYRIVLASLESDAQEELVGPITVIK